MKLNRFAIALLLGTSLMWACNNDAETDGENDMVDSTAVEPATADTASGTGMNSGDATEFTTAAASGGMMEVELGQMTKQNAQSARVKSFGEMMVRDHTKANNELKALAANKNIKLPESLKEKHADHVKEVGAKRGQEFDKAYMDMMVTAHEEDISKFESAANNLNDPDLKAFAAKTLPVLRMHLDSARAIHQSMQ